MQKRDGGIKHTHTQPRTYCSRARTWRERGRKGEWRDLSFWTRGQEGQACQEPHGRTDKCVEHAAASSQWWLVMIKLVKVLVPHMYVTLKQTNKQNISSFKPGLYPGSPQESPDKASWSEMYLFIFLYSYRSKQSDLIRHSNPITSVAYVRLPQTRLSKHFLKCFPSEAGNLLFPEGRTCGYVLGKSPCSSLLKNPRTVIFKPWEGS